MLNKEMLLTSSSQQGWTSFYENVTDAALLLLTVLHTDLRYKTALLVISYSSSSICMNYINKVNAQYTRDTITFSDDGNADFHNIPVDIESNLAFHTGQVSEAGTLIEAYGPLEDELAQAYVGPLDLPIPKYEKRTIDKLGAKYAHICTFTGVQEEKDDDGLYVCSFMEEYTNPYRTRFNLADSCMLYLMILP